MCGIIGYIGEKEANDILIQGLERLEYRGYDSDLISSENRFSYKRTGSNQNMNYDVQKLKDIQPSEEGMNILNFMNPEDYYCRISLSFQKILEQKITNYTKIGKTVNVSRATIARISTVENYWMNFETLLVLASFLNITKNEIFDNITSIKTHNSFPVYFNLKNLKSPALFRIIGHILGDGGIHVAEKAGRFKAFYTNNKKELIDSFSQDVKEIFGEFKLYHRIRASQVNEIWLPTTIGTIFYNIMNYEVLNKKKRIPKFIFETHDKYLLGTFLQALYDDEGYLYPEKRMIVIAQKSRDLIDDIRQVVIKLGIRPNQILIHRSKNRTTMYYFSITHRDNFKIFNEYIGFKHPVKIKKLEMLMKKYEEQ